MSKNQKHYSGHDKSLSQKIILDRSALKYPYGFILGESGVSGKIVDGKVFKYKVSNQSSIK